MFTLGLDLSTQSLSAVILQDTASGPVHCGTWSVPFRDLAQKYQLDSQNLCLPPSKLGGYENFFAQDPQMFLESLDLLFGKMKKEGAPLQKIALINSSTQQHGQVWLTEGFAADCAKLSQRGRSSTLPETFAQSYAYPAAPVWMCSQTAAEAEYVTSTLGEERVLAITGSAAPLRFSGLVLRWLALRASQAFEQCHYVHLLSSWLAAVLSGTCTAPIDWGSGAGTLLMDYREKTWSKDLLACLEEGLTTGIRKKLPELASPLATVARLAPYFRKYGFDGACKVLVGSGDNPQAKVCQRKDLLSLGSSFVLMSCSTQFHPWINAMYDGLGQPFSFACRTNGALVWDAYRKHLGLSLEQEEEALAKFPLGSVSPSSLRLLPESFPPLPPTAADIRDFQSGHTDAAKKLVAVIDASLLELCDASATAFGQNRELLYLTGGASQSAEIVKRLTEIWQRPTQAFTSSGAAYGAALAAIIGERSSDL